MKYIKIKNIGLIEPQALYLVGASTKRNDFSKIGQFGSGNKYALAFFLRNGYEVKVFSGLNEIKIETRKETFRDHDFNVIYVNGEKSSITTEMGKDWVFWQAIREIYANSLDEGGCCMDFVHEVSPVDNETHFYIRNSKDVTEFVTNFDNYFSTNKKVLFECKEGKILAKSGTEGNIYRRGIRCFNTNRTSVFDYDFSDIIIDENRLIRYTWQVEEYIWSLIYQCDNEEVIMQVLHNSVDVNYLEGCISDVATISSSKMSDTFKKCINANNLAPKGFAGLLKEDEIHTHIILPTKVFQSVRGVIGDENVGDKFKVSRHGTFFREIESNELQTATIKQAKYFFEETDFDIPFEIVLAIFDNKDIMGCAHEGKIILSEICIENGVNEVVNTILEEYIHLKYKAADETRGFQTAIITEMISYMKKKNAFLI